MWYDIQGKVLAPARINSSLLGSRLQVEEALLPVDIAGGNPPVTLTVADTLTVGIDIDRLRGRQEPRCLF